MSRVGVVVSVLLAATAGSAAVQWQPTLDGARTLAMQTNRLVLIHFWSQGCPPCARMESDVFSRPDVAEAIDRHYVAAKVNVAHFPALARQYGVEAFPTDVIIAPDGRVIGKYSGAIPADTFIGRLDQIASISGGNRSYAQQPGASGWNQQPAQPMQAARGPVSPPTETQMTAYGQQAPPAMPAGLAYNQPRTDPAMAAPVTPRYSEQVASTGDRYQPYNSGVQAYGAPSGGPGQQAGPSNGYGPIDPAPSAYGVRGTSREAAPEMMAAAQSPTNPANPYGRQDRPGQTVGPPTASSPNSLAGLPPLALDGFCPVSLAEQWQWVPGNPKWGVFHEGRTYLFAGSREQQMFLAPGAAERYAPVRSGHDVVALVEQGQEVAGVRDFGARWNDRVYLFSSQQNYETFRADPTRYEVVPSGTPVARHGAGNAAPVGQENSAYRRY